MFFSYIIVSLFISDISSTDDSVTVSISPLNPVGKIRGQIHFRFKQIPVEYEPISIKLDGIFGRNKEIFSYSKNPEDWSLNPFRGHVLYADNNEAILYNLIPDFNDGKLRFIFYSRITKKMFTISSKKIRIFPEIAEFKLDRVMKRNLFPFKSIPTLDPYEKYTIKFKKYSNDQYPVNYISLFPNGKSLYGMKKIEIFDGKTNYSELQMKYDQNEQTLSESKIYHFNRLLNVQIMAIRLYKNFFNIYSTGFISIEDFYENFKINHITASWDIRPKYQNQFSYKMFYYDGIYRNQYTEAIECSIGDRSCSIMKNENNIFKSATFNSFTLKECPLILKFTILFLVRFHPGNINGNTLERSVEFDFTNSDCETSKAVFPQQSAEPEFEIITVNVTKGLKGLTSPTNVQSFIGEQFCLKETHDKIINSNLESVDEIQQSLLADALGEVIEHDMYSDSEEINIYSIRRELVNLTTKEKVTCFGSVEFTSEKISDIQELFGIDKNPTPPPPPQTDVKVEEHQGPNLEVPNDSPSSPDKQFDVSIKDEILEEASIDEPELVNPNPIPEPYNADEIAPENKITPAVARSTSAASISIVVILIILIIGAVFWFIFYRRNERRHMHNRASFH